MNDTIAALGELSLWLAFIVSLWGAAAAALARRDIAPPLLHSAVRGTIASAALVAVAVATLWVLLVRQDFSYLIVAATTHRELPYFYRITALWSSQRGGTVLWALVMTAVAAVAVQRQRSATGTRERLATGLLAGAGAVFVGLALLSSRPFSRMDYPLAEGLGMPGELQHVGAALEPVLLTSGMAALAVALILSIADRFGRRTSAVGGWEGSKAASSLPWFVAALTAMCAGLLIEAWSTYHELGWGEYSRRTVIGSLVAVPVMVAILGAAWALGSRRELRHRLIREVRVPIVAGLALLVAGGVAFQFRRDAGFVMTSGQVERFVDSFGSSWRLTSLGLSNDRHGSESIESLGVEITRPDGRTLVVRTDRVGRTTARGEDIGEPQTVAALEAGPRGDLIVAMDDTFEDRALLRVRFVPLSILVWLGGILLLAGLLAGLLRVIRRQGAE